MKVPVQTTPRTQRASGGIPFIRSGGASIDAQSNADLAQAAVQFGNTLGSLGGLIREQQAGAVRFSTLQSFSDFNSQVEERLSDMQRNADPRLANFHDIATASYDKWAQEWLETVPDDLHDEFATRAADIRQSVSRNALAFQYESTDNYFRQGISDLVNKSLLSLDQDGGAVNLENQRRAVDEFINTTTLTEAEKVQMRRAAYIKLESTSYKAEVRRGAIEADDLGVGTSAGTAADLILQFDGASQENGLDYATNRQLVTQRVQDATAGAIAAIGSTEIWEALPSHVQAVLISLQDDLGELPPSVVEAVNNNDLDGLIAVVKEMGGERRETEANILDGNADLPQGLLDADPRYANIPYEDRLALRADAERELAAERTEAERQAKAQQEAQFNNLMVNIWDGRAGQWHLDMAREEGWLTDYDQIKKAQDALDKITGDLQMVGRMQQHIAAGIPINPGSEDDRKMFNAYIGEQGLLAMRELDTQYVTNVLVPAVRAAGDLPTDVVGQLTGMTRAQDPQMALYALDTLNQLEQASPAAYLARVPEALQADVEFWRSVKDYYPMEEVLGIVRGGTTQEERTRTTMLRDQARKLLNDGSVNTTTAAENFVKTQLIPIMGDSPVWRHGEPTFTPAAMEMIEVDFSNLFEREYARHGNEQKAIEDATKALKKVWGTTVVGGTQTLMRYPPELAGYEPWNGSHDWITEQGREILGLSENQSFQLISDEATKAEFTAWQTGQGPRPSYIPVYYDEHGDLNMAFDDAGKPQRIFFEITEEMDQQKIEQFNQKQAQLEFDTINKTYQQARRHYLTTGTPIPEDIQAQYDAMVAEQGVPRSTFNVFQGWGQSRGEAAAQQNPFDNAPPPTPVTPEEVNISDLSPVEGLFLGALRQAEGIGAGGTALRLFNDIIQRGRTEPITQNDFAADELTALKELVLRTAGDKTSGTVDYKDYRGSSFDSNILGGFRYSIENGVITISDTYDFNADRADGSEDNVFVQALALVAAPRNLAASIGRKKLSDTDGNGVPVMIRIVL